MIVDCETCKIDLLETESGRLTLDTRTATSSSIYIPLTSTRNTEADVWDCDHDRAVHSGHLGRGFRGPMLLRKTKQHQIAMKLALLAAAQSGFEVAGSMATLR